MDAVNSTGTAAKLKSIYSTGRNNKTYTPYSIAEDAPIYSYQVPKHGFNTWGLKDTGGQEWYLTTGGQWRNAKTDALSKTHPGYAPAAATPTAETPVTAPPAPEVAPTWKSIWDFQPNQYKDAFNTAPTQIKSFWDYFPKNPGTSAAYTYAQDRGNQDLDKRLSAMGLLGSGVDLQKREDLQRANLSDEVGRLMEATTQDYSGYLTGLQQDASNTQNAQKILAGLIGSDFGAYQNAVSDDKNVEISKDGQKLDAVGMALDFIKTLNPMQYAFPASTTSADLSTQLGKALASLQGVGGGGGGASGGGGSGASELPEAPGGFSSTDYFIDSATKFLPILSSLFK